MSFSIGHKILSGFLLIIVVCLGCIIFLSNTVNKCNSLTTDNLRMFNNYREINTVKNSLQKQIYLLEHYNIHSTPENNNNIKKELLLNFNIISKLTSQVFNKTLNIDIKKHLSSVQHAEKTIFSNFSFRNSFKRSLHELNSIEKKIIAVENLIANTINTNVESIESFTAFGASLGLITLITLLLLSILISLFIAKTIITPIRKLVASAQLVGGGDFSDNAATDIHSDNEIGDLAESFDMMRVKLEQYQKKLLIAERSTAIAQIVNSVNHEINNPMMILSGNIEYLLGQIDKLPKDLQEILKAIKTESDRITEIIAKLKNINAKETVLDEYIGNDIKMVNIHKSEGK